MINPNQKSDKSAKFKDTMRPEYDMTGGVRGKYAIKPKGIDAAEEQIFSAVGFDSSLRSSFHELCKVIESQGGCDAWIYKPPNMGQMRAAHFPPGGAGAKKAKQVFLMVEPQKRAMVLFRRRRFRKGKPKEEWRIVVDESFGHWNELLATLKEWSQDVKEVTKPKLGIEWGDGHALPGGLPETNRAKF